MLYLLGNDQLICFLFKQNHLCKLWFYELIPRPPPFFSTDFYPLKQDVLLPPSTDLCYTGNIQK